MSRWYNQKDSSFTFTEACALTIDTPNATAARGMIATAGFGVTEVTVDPGNNQNAICFALDANDPNQDYDWPAGDWVVRLNITTCDAGTRMTRIWICDKPSTAPTPTFTNVADKVVTTGEHARGATGVVTVTINQASDHTPQGTNSFPYIVVSFDNIDPHGQSSVGITPDQVVDTPLVKSRSLSEQVTLSDTVTATVTTTPIAAALTETIDLADAPASSATFEALAGSAAVGTLEAFYRMEEASGANDRLDSLGAAALRRSLYRGLTKFFRFEDATDELGGPSLQATGTVTYTSGLLGNAATIGTGGNYLREFDDADEDTWLPGDDGYTVGFWIKADAGVGDNVQDVFQIGAFHDLNIRLDFNVGVNNVDARIGNGTSSSAATTSNGIISKNNWFFILYRLDTATTTLHLSVYDATGVEVGSASADYSTTIPTFAGTNNVFLGSSNNFGGQVDSLVHYKNRSISDPEAEFLVNGGAGREYDDLEERTSLLSGLEAFWRFEVVTATTADSHNAFTLDRIGSPAPSAFGKHGNCVSFAAGTGQRYEGADASNIGTGDATFAGWVLAETTAPTAGTFVRLASTPRPEIQFATDGVQVEWNDGTPVTSTTTGTALAADVWYFVVLRLNRGGNAVIQVFDSAGAQVGSDGILDISSNSSDNLASGYVFEDIGGSQLRQDSWGVWLRSLSDREVRELLNYGNGRDYADLTKHDLVASGSLGTVAGKHGTNALNLDTAGSFLKGGPVAGTDDVTVTFWFQHAFINQGGEIIHQGERQSHAGWALQQASLDDQVRWTVTKADLTLQFNTILGFDFADATWYFIAITYDRSGNAVLRVYNEAGALVHTVTQSISAINGEFWAYPLRFGGGNTGDEPRIDSFAWHRALLTDAEIRQLLRGGNGRDFSDLYDTNVDLTDLITATISGGVAASITETIELADSVSATITSPQSVSENVDLADSVARVITTSQSLSEQLDLADSATRVVSASRSLSESIELSDLFDASVTIGGAVSEAIELADNVSCAIVASASVSEIAELSDSVAAAVVTSQTISEQVELADAATGALVTSQSISEQIDLASTVDEDTTLGASVAESIDLAESSTRSVTASRSTSEAIELSDSLSSTLTTAQSASEQLDLSDTFSAVVTASRSVAEQVELSDSVDEDTTLGASLSEQIDLASATDRAVVASRSVTESIELSDVFVTNADRVATASEQVDLADSVASSAVTSASASEQVDLADSVSATITKEVATSEQVDLADSASSNVDAVASADENVDLSDALASSIVTSQTISENVDLSDTIAASVGESASLSESLELSDSVSTTIDTPQSASETLELSDAISATIVTSQSVSEQIDLSDQFTATVDAGVTPAALTETVELSDSISASVVTSATITVTITLSDLVSRTADRAAQTSEPILLSDAASSTLIVSRSLSEALELAATTTGDVGILATLSESLLLSSDEAVSADVVAQIAQALELADDFAGATISSAAIAEVVELVESVVSGTAVAANVADVLTLVDSVVATTDAAVVHAIVVTLVKSTALSLSIDQSTTVALDMIDEGSVLDLTVES